MAKTRAQVTDRVDFAGLADDVRIALMGFKTQYQQITQKHEAETARIREMFTQKHVHEELKKSDAVYDVKLDDARSCAKKTLEDRFIRVESTMDSVPAEMPDSETFRKLQVLADLPMTANEFKCLAQTYGGYNLWQDRFLKGVADRNNIDVQKLDLNGVDLTASYDVQCQAIQDLKNSFNDFIDKYQGDGNTPYRVQLAVSDSTIQRYEDSFYGKSNPHYTAKQSADRILAQIASAPNLMSKSLGTVNALETAEGNQRKYLLSGLQQDGFDTVVDTLPENLRNEIRNFDGSAFQTSLTAAQKAYDRCHELKAVNPHDYDSEVVRDEQNNSALVSDVRSAMHDPVVSEYIHEAGGHDSTVADVLNRMEKVSNAR